MKFNFEAYDKLYPREEIKSSPIEDDNEDSMIEETPKEEKKEEVKTVEVVDEDKGGTDDGTTGTSDPSTE